jgi:hypothetical protein
MKWHRYCINITPISLFRKKQRHNKTLGAANKCGAEVMAQREDKSAQRYPSAFAFGEKQRGFVASAPVW